MHLQAAVDLTEPLAGGFTQLLHQLRQTTKVGVHPCLNLAQLGVDEFLTPGQRGVGCLRMGAELLAGEQDCLLDSGLHRHVALACRALVGLGDCGRYGLLHHLLGNLEQHRLGGRSQRDTTVGQQPRNGGSGANEENHKEGNQYDFHTPHHDERV